MVVAIRPGMIDSWTTRREAAEDPSVYRMAPHIKAAIEAGEALSPEAAGTDIWAPLPPPADTSVLQFGAMPSGVLAEAAAKKAASTTR